MSLLIFLLTAFNCFLILKFVYQLVGLNENQLYKPIKIYTAVFITLFLLSFVEYFALITNLSFYWILSGLTILNAILFYYLRPSFAFDWLKQMAAAKTETKVVMVLVFAMSVFFYFHASKYGSFDAWALWNTHAKFLYYSHLWKRMFDDSSLMSHADYPLMLPSLVAFFWHSCSGASFIVPLLLSFSFVLLNALLIYHGLRKFTNAGYATIGMLIVVADPNFQIHNSAQCADTLLAMFILLCVILFSEDKQDSISTAIIMGIIAAACTWIKNEGDLFFMMFTIVFLIKYAKNPKFICCYFAGVVLPMLTTLSFKLFFSPPNDLVAGNKDLLHQTLGRLIDPSRYTILLKMGLDVLVSNFWILIVLVLLVAVFRRGSLITLPFILLYMVFAGYVVILITTPHNLQWHIHNSVDRLILHIYPAFVFLTVVALFKANFFKFQGEPSFNRQDKKWPA